MLGTKRSRCYTAIHNIWFSFLREWRIGHIYSQNSHRVKIKMVQCFALQSTSHCFTRRSLLSLPWVLYDIMAENQIRSKHLSLFVIRNSRKICSLDRFTWRLATFRNVHHSAERKGLSQCLLPTASLKMHPVSVWVLKVANKHSREIWPK